MRIALTRPRLDAVITQRTEAARSLTRAFPPNPNPNPNLNPNQEDAEADEDKETGQAR